jgi:hypothetical protein
VQPCIVIYIYIYIYIYMNLMEETIWSMFVPESLKVLGASRLLFLGGKNYFCKTSI